MQVEQVSNAEIEWQEDGLPWSPRFQDVYFSRADPSAETSHVFLEGNRLPERFQQLQQPGFVIGELGFGSGLNFLCACRLWQQLAPAGATLNFISAEQYPLTRQDLLRFHALWPDLAAYSQALQTQYQAEGSGLQRYHFTFGHHHVILDLLLGDASEQFQALASRALQPVDAWFLDGFAPRSNPAMWARCLFDSMARLSHRDTTVATYSVAALVKQGLTEAGFAIEKRPGFGNKRHMLCARLDQGRLMGASVRGKRVAVIGSGLAGSACAFALARQGMAVDVFEQGAEVAPGASGNPQGALFLPLHRAPNQRAHLLRQAALFACRHYQHLSTDLGREFGWHADGILQLHEKNGPGFFEAVQANPLYPSALLDRMDSAAASEAAGVPLARPGLMLNMGGWLSPRALCLAQLAEPGIQIHLSSEVRALTADAQGWRLELQTAEGQEESALFDAVILANSVQAPQLLPRQGYPLYPNRGQLSFLAPSPLSHDLKRPLCGKGYLLPAWQGQLCLGSSFHPRCDDSGLRDEDVAHNLALLEALAPGLYPEGAASAVIGGRASLRCTTDDYLPLAGAIEDRDATLSACETLSPAERPRQSFVQYQEGLYLCAGLGSHGITTAPLLADLLCSEICGLNPPLADEDQTLLAPARFLLRQLRQQNHEPQRLK